MVAEEVTQAHDGSGHWTESFGGHRCVYSSGIAPHNFERLSLILKPRQNESYHLWYIVGGGGGHSLHISNMSVHALVFDDRRRTFGQVLNFFDNSNTLRSWDETESSSQVHRFHSDALNAVLTSTSHALTHGLKVLPPMISFFADYGVPEADLSPKLIELISSVRNDWEQELSIYTNAEHIGDEQEDDEGGGEDLVPHQQRYFRVRPAEEERIQRSQLRQRNGHPGLESQVRRGLRFSFREMFGRR